MKFALLGAAGGIGQSLSLLLKLQLPAGSELALYDVVPVTPGVAVDVSHIPTAVKVTGYCAEWEKDPETGKPIKIVRSDIDKALTGADLVIITAGVARKPGMTRQDLLKVNAGIVGGLAKDCAKYCPQASIAVVTNPVNTTVPLVARVLKAQGTFNAKKLFGVTMLDTQRAETFVAQEFGYDPKKLNISVVGGHSETTILPLFSQMNDGRISEDAMEALRKHVRDGGSEVVAAKAGAGSATLSMANAAARFVGVVVRGMMGDPTAIANAFVENAQCGLPFFAQPVRFGKNGIEDFLPLGSMSEAEKKTLDELLPDLKKSIDAANDLAI